MKSLASILIPSSKRRIRQIVTWQMLHPKGRQFLVPIRGVWGKHPSPRSTWQQNSRC